MLNSIMEFSEFALFYVSLPLCLLQFSIRKMRLGLNTNLHIENQVLTSSKKKVRIEYLAGLICYQSPSHTFALFNETQLYSMEVALANLEGESL